MSSISAAIRRIRKDRKETQGEFAEALGFSRAETVSDWERGVSSPDEGTLEKIASLAGKSRVELFGAAEGAGDVGEFVEGRMDHSFVEVLLREARAAEKRAEAAASWARWLEKEADASERVRIYAMQREQMPTGAKPSPYRPAPRRKAKGKDQDAAS